LKKCEWNYSTDYLTGLNASIRTEVNNNVEMVESINRERMDNL
jgi:hypothetical protein